MGYAAFVDDNIEMGRAWMLRDQCELRQAVLSSRGALTLAEDCGGDVIGCTVAVNRPLTALYGFECLVVKFTCSWMNTLHAPEQEAACTHLMARLWALLRERHAYVDLRLPSHLGDLLRAFNATKPEGLIFCGGTVEEIGRGRVLDVPVPEDVRLFVADEAYAQAHRQTLAGVANDSFAEYQGQYHLAPATAGQAGQIYRNWIEQGIAPGADRTLWIAEADGAPVGFLLCRENGEAIDEELGCVAAGYRGRGIYKALVAQAIGAAGARDGFFVSSTQLDNLGSQTTWAHLGMTPLYSFYHFHYDNRTTEAEEC